MKDLACDEIESPRGRNDLLILFGKIEWFMLIALEIEPCYLSLS